MKIEFEDGSFITIENVIENDQLLLITMCGLVNNKKSVMSTSIIGNREIEKIVNFLQQWQKNHSVG